MAKHSNSNIAKVAVITRTKNRPVFLERAIKSIHQQTMTDFVHVIVNDAGDPEAFNKVIEKYKDLTRGRVKIIHNKVSSGMEAASNKAIKSVDSEFVAIHDDDDTWHPDFLKKTTEHMEQTGGMGVVVTTDQVIERIVGNAIHTVSLKRWHPEAHEVSLYKMCLDNYTTPITFIYRREVYKKIGYYDEELKVCGDLDFGLRFIRNWDIDFLDTDYALAYYHHRPEVTGIAGNSVFAGIDQHRHFNNLLANRYLRQDLNGSGLGMGYLFNKLKEDRRETLKLYKKLNKMSRRLERVETLLIERTSVHRASSRLKPLPKRISRKLMRMFLVEDGR